MVPVNCQLVSLNEKFKDFLIVFSDANDHTKNMYFRGNYYNKISISKIIITINKFKVTINIRVNKAISR